MKVFYEKANDSILRQCQDFILNNKNVTADYYVFRKALELYAELSQSLLESQNEFNDAIKKETDKIVYLQQDIEKQIAVNKFNQANYTLVLDRDAHSVLEQLETIERNNSRL